MHCDYTGQEFEGTGIIVLTTQGQQIMSPVGYGRFVTDCQAQAAGTPAAVVADPAPVVKPLPADTPAPAADTPPVTTEAPPAEAAAPVPSEADVPTNV